MAIKTYSEMVKIDVSSFCEHKESKDDKGKKIQVPYLNWAKCKQLLHENGAENVYFEPIINDKTGSTLFMSDIPFSDKNGQTNRCFEVRVKIVIDDLEFVQNYPLMNGMYVVREDTLNQLRLSNAQARAFVKGVAIRTGLGFHLWLKDDETTLKADTDEDLSIHKIMKIRDRMFELITELLKKGKDKNEIAKICGFVDDEEMTIFYKKNFSQINNVEVAMRKALMEK